MTLGVSDLQRATRFYEGVLDLPRLESPPSIAFFELGRTWLSLYPRHLLAEDAGVSSEGSDSPGFTLAHNAGSEAEVDRVIVHGAADGGRIMRPPETQRE